jgi:predicted nucleic acid-binding protein
MIDTCVLIDLIMPGAPFARAAAACLNRCQSDGLAICPVVFIELGPAFQGDAAQQENFLSDYGIEFLGNWDDAATREAWMLWHQHIAGKRLGLTRKRPAADALIAAFAMRRKGLITRNTTDFRSLAPSLSLIDPTALS